MEKISRGVTFISAGLIVTSQLTNVLNGRTDNGVTFR